MGARQRAGGGEDKTEAVGVDPRLSSLLSLFGVRVYVQGRQSVYAGVCQLKSMFVSKKTL